ncbi:MAG: DUF1566 domain-containing protein [Nitrospina sp.]|jgi:hypothetical protein|nr:DUF1566 domain-containing protein [Nitrospina sp.]MBT6717099.1 DUF1566 domain-containing protein [Nitrospina sp.]
MFSKVLAYFFSSVLVALFLFSNPAWAGPFKVNNNGTVTDEATGLVWQKGDSFHDLKKGLNWYDALEYITLKNSEKFAGHNNWRLPTLQELNNLWQATGKVKSKDDEILGLASEFKNGGSYYLWTGEERGLDHAWYFGLGQKENYFNLKDLADLEQGVKMVRQRDAGP